MTTPKQTSGKGISVPLQTHCRRLRAAIQALGELGIRTDIQWAVNPARRTARFELTFSDFKGFADRNQTKKLALPPVARAASTVARAASTSH